jgi:alkylhydroperoxidase family enzyme
MIALQPQPASCTGTRGGRGKIPRLFSVFVAPMPIAFGNLFGKVSKLDKKLTVPEEIATLITARVASLNMCMYCIDSQRWP